MSILENLCDYSSLHVKQILVKLEGVMLTCSFSKNSEIELKVLKHRERNTCGTFTIYLHIHYQFLLLLPDPGLQFFMKKKILKFHENMNEKYVSKLSKKLKERQKVFASWCFLLCIAYPAPENMSHIFRNFVKFQKIFRGNFQTFTFSISLV